MLNRGTAVASILAGHLSKQNLGKHAMEYSIALLLICQFNRFLILIISISSLKLDLSIILNNQVIILVRALGTMSLQNNKSVY